MELDIPRKGKAECLELKKHINAIHCTNSLTLLQRKLFNALLFNAYTDLPYKSNFEIRTKRLCEIMGYNSNDYARLKKSIMGLITTAIEWNVIDAKTEKETEWKASAILASAELKNGYCRYEYSEVIRELFFRPDIYGRIDMNLVSRFKSSYGLALYENCIRYQGLPQTQWFPLETFRKLMGVSDGKYAEFKNIKKRVINIAVNEVNTISPIEVLPEIERENQKVTRIRFKIKKKSVPKLNMKEEVGVDNSLIDILSRTFKFSQSTIKQVLSDYDPDYIKKKVEMILQSDNFLAGKIRGLAGYLVDALKRDYQPSGSSKVVVDEKIEKIQATKERRRKEEKNNEERYRLYLKKKIGEYAGKLSKDSYALIINSFELSLKQQVSSIWKWYKEHGLEHPAIQGLFNSFIIENHQREAKILSQEEFFSIIEEL